MNRKLFFLAIVSAMLFLVSQFVPVFDWAKQGGGTALGPTLVSRTDSQGDLLPGELVVPGTKALGKSPKRSDSIPNVTLVTHEGKSIRFRDDLVSNRKVVINFMYTVCDGICPGMTENIKKVREDLAAKGVEDVTFISISIDPDQDNPEQLRNYMLGSGIENKPGLSPWIFLTGDLEDIDQVRRSLGVYDPDPEIDSDRRQHGGTLTFGNDRSDWWGATPALQRPKWIVQTLERNIGSDDRVRPSLVGR